MFKLKNSIAALAALFAISGVTQAAVIDFESAALGNYSTLTIDGVTISGSLTISDDSNGAYVNAPIGTNFLDNRRSGGLFTFTFAPVDYFGLQIGASNFVHTMSAYDSLNNLLGSITIPNQVGTMPFPYTGFYELTFDDMAKVVLTGNEDWIILDNVTTNNQGNDVPEPASLALLGLGLAGLGLGRRRQHA